MKITYIHMCVIQIIGKGLLTGTATPSQKMAGSIAYVCICQNMHIISVKLACFKKVLSVIIDICLVDMYTNTCMQPHTYAPAHTSTLIHTSTQTHIYTQKHTYVHINTYTYTNTRTYIHTQTHVCTHKHTYIHTYVHAHYTHRKTCES